MTDHEHQCSIIGPYCVVCHQDWKVEWNPPENPDTIRHVRDMVLEDMATKYSETKVFYDDQIRKAELEQRRVG